MASGFQVKLPPGRVALHFDSGTSVGTPQWCVLTFVPDEHPTPAILVADPQLTLSEDFDMDAVPAQAG